MAKGFIRGALWGACVSLGAVTLISVAAEGPERSVDASQVADAGAGGTSLQTSANPTQAPTPDTLAGLGQGIDRPAAVPLTGGASSLTATELPATSAQDGVARETTRVPRVATAQTESLSTPTTEPAFSVSTDPAQPPAPTLATPKSAFDTTQDVAVADPVMPEAPEIAAVDTGSISNDPAQPATPEVQTETSAFDTTARKSEQVVQAGSAATVEGPAPQVMSSAPEQTNGDLEIAPVTPAPTTIADGAQVPDAPQPQVTTDITPEEGFEVASVAFAAPEVAAEADAPQEAATDDLAAPASADMTQAAGESETASVNASVSVEDAPQAPIIAPAAPNVPTTLAITTAASAPAPAAPEPSRPDAAATPDQAQFVANNDVVETPVQSSNETVRVNRLPSLTQPEEDAPEQEVVVEDVGQAADDVPPVLRNAEPFDNPEGKPVMSIVLMDQGQELAAEKIGLPALRSFPYPVTFAVDAMLPDAKERIAAYRAEGFEVLAMIDLPKGATAKDAETNMAVALDRVPDVVGVLEGVKTGVQTTRDSGRQVAQILAQTGHGFVTQSVGLNTVQKLAAKEGVPSATVFRDFDNKGQNSAVIRRFLDQAAFRAGQEGGVIMLGRLREETVSALLLWGLQDRAARVALVPVSGALNAAP